MSQFKMLVVAFAVLCMVVVGAGHTGDGKECPYAKAAEGTAKAECAKDCPYADYSGCSKTNILGVAEGAGAFKTLIAAIDAAGLAEVLGGEGPFTVFAPTDDAFKALPEGTLDSLLKPENKDQLVAVLKNHVVAGKVMASDVAGLTSAKTLLESELPVSVCSESGVKVGDAKVVKTDIIASNGVIHVIDSVLVPAS